MILPFLDPVHHAVGLTVALELVFGAVEEVTYLYIGAVILGIGTLEHLLQTGRDILQCHPSAAIGIGLRRPFGLFE